jgi:alkanesulfonate monooxygenase SsuD/methylene tetrahydromethanopterin reductase-like flavin-dependent oxidoreductase (luciferase family)
MKVGIGLPSTIPGATGDHVIEWARRAEAAGFSCLGTIDRLVYPNYDPLVALAGAAAVTERIELTTAILILPHRGPAAVVAKQAASLHVLSGGRLVLGVAIGARDDDYTATGIGTEGRGQRLEEMLDEIKRLWAGEERGYAGGVGPDVSKDPPPIIVGGHVEAAFRRAAGFGDGWMMGAASADDFRQAREALEAAWGAGGRDGEPRKMALNYFSLDDDPQGALRASVWDYYSFAGPYADMVVDAATKSEDEVRERVRAFEDAGCDELILFPASSDPQQVDRLAAAVL